MAHFCWQLKLLILLLMLCRCQSRPRPDPLPTGRHSELIAGNEFLKLFLDHDEQRNLHSNEEFEGRGDATTSSSNSRINNARSLEHKTRYRNANSQHEADDEGKQVVKLVTSGSKIVFLEDPPHQHQSKTKLKDEVKVVAVSVSSSSKRGPPSRGRINSPISPVSASGSDFVNRSHKSELSIEETEPRLAPDAMEGENGDSLNSASNIQNVLAAPLVAAFGRNQSETDDDDKLLPFQTVIYHDTKPGISHGPQSRSISYSSISQNVEDLQGWQQSAGILAEAQRNVSESLKQGQSHASEPAKFYSLPSKMYSVPSKFYSEPAKVYSEPAKMYGQPEKVYSEPAKVYSQPSKFYSEPAKVYSQPAKVYGEPAKTYWPHTLVTTTVATTTTKTTTTTTTATTNTGNSQSSSVETPLATTTATPPITVPPGAAPTTFVPSRLRRPAIVSRIAFGEAQTTTATTKTTTALSTAIPATATTKPSTTRATTTATATGTSAIVRPTTWQQHYHSHHHHNHLLQQQQLQQQQQQQQQQRQPPSATASQPRRVLFNLDKLPYDLLNAPQPQQQQQQPSHQQQHLLEPILSKSDYQQQQHHHHRPCWEQRQHSSLSLQHSNQNAKGLPNRDLVKCVSTKFAQQHPASVSAYSYSSSSTSSSSSSSLGRVRDPVMPQHFTTERSELYTPTPEQNYEIEESVSVMTNGRAHGLQGNGGNTVGGSGLSSVLAIATTPASPVTTLASASASASAASAATSTRNRGIDRGRGSVVYNANANANDYSDDGVDDDREGDGNGDGNDDGDGDGNGNGNGNGDESDEDKVAYVVEGRNYRKYRVEEKTDDGFIVGEYGVVDHNDGNLRGVRYTADSTINRSLIQKALLTFLKLK